MKTSIFRQGRDTRPPGLTEHACTGDGELDLGCCYIGGRNAQGYHATAMQNALFSAQQHIGVRPLKAHPGAEAAQVAEHKCTSSPIKPDMETGYAWIVHADGCVGGSAAVHWHVVWDQRACSTLPLQMDLAQDRLLRVFQFRQ